MPDAWFRNGAFPALSWFSVGQPWSEGFHAQGNLTGTLPQITGGAMLRLRACTCLFVSTVLCGRVKVEKYIFCARLIPYACPLRSAASSPRAS